MCQTSPQYIGPGTALNVGKGAQQGQNTPTPNQTEFTTAICRYI